MEATLGAWSASFSPARGMDDETLRFLIDEVWNRNDYRVPLAGFSGVVLDVGANIGVFSILAARAGAAAVVAVEPLHWATLELNTYANGVQDLVTTLPFAIAEPGVDRVAMIDRGPNSHVTDDPEGRVVAAFPLEGLIMRHESIELLKLDVEGCEYAILETLPDHALARVQRIAAEFHYPHHDHAPLRGGEIDSLTSRLAPFGTVELDHEILHWRNTTA